MSFLECKFHGIIEFKKMLEDKIEKLDKMLSIGKGVGNNRGLAFTHEHTTSIPSKTMFISGSDTSQLTQVIQKATIVKKSNKDKNAKDTSHAPFAKKNLIFFTCGQHDHYSSH